MEDLTLRRLTKKVFPYIWLRHKLMSSIPSTGIFPFSEMTVFAQAIGNAVIVYLHMYRPTLSNYLEKHIPSMPQSKKHFWTHVAFICLQVRLVDDDVFDYFLTACSITAEVALHCYMNGYDDVLPYASGFFCAFFETELYESFHKAKGWVGLHQYIKDTACPELYELVNGYIKRISSPSEHLPILISIEREYLAAERREKFTSLRSFKIGEIERDEQARTLVSGIFHWDFTENQRISEVRPGILKRMENIRHKKNKSNIFLREERSDESTEANEVLEPDNKISDAHKVLCLPDEAQTSESADTMFKTRSNYKDEQTLEDLKCTEVRKEKNQLCASNETSGKAKFSSSSNLREIRNFYESLSAPSEATMDDSKCFRNNDGTRNGLKSASIKGMTNKCEKSHFETYPRFTPYASENGGTFPKSENFTPETVIKSTESFHADALSELTKSFQELGFNCLCAGKSSHDDKKSGAFKNYTEIMEKCRYFQSKYSSTQFVILIPNDYFTEKTSHSPGTENCDETRFERQYNEQDFPSTTTKDFENCTVSPQRLHSEAKKSRFSDTKVDENQLRLANGRANGLQNYTIQSIQNSRFLVKKIEENDLMSRGEALKISRFSVTKVNENRIISRNGASLLENICTAEHTTESRFRVAKVNENQSKDKMIALHKNWTSETTKISRFTVTQINENRPMDGTSLPGKNWGNETTKISRFTVTKINENKSKDPTSILKKNWKNETTKISRFTVTKINENKSKDPTSVLKKNCETETTKPSRFTVKKVDDDQLTSRAGTSLRKSCSTNTTKISRFSVTKVEESQSGSTERNYSISSETADVTENETVQFQDNGSVTYQRRVSFAEHPSITYYHTDSSDESRDSRESLNQNSLEDSQSSRKSEQSASTLRNTLMSETRGLLRRFSFSGSRSSSDNARGSITSFGANLFGRIFRRSNSRNSTVNESQTKQTSEQEVDE